MKTTTELKGWIEDTPMTRYQWLIISICILIYTIDGLDILAMVFTAHSVSQSWGLIDTEKLPPIKSQPKRCFLTDVRHHRHFVNHN